MLVPVLNLMSRIGGLILSLRMSTSYHTNEPHLIRPHRLAGTPDRDAIRR